MACPNKEGTSLGMRRTRFYLIAIFYFSVPSPKKSCWNSMRNRWGREMAAPGVVDGAGAVPEIHHGTLEAADVPPWRNIDISTRFFILLFLPVGLALTGAIVSSFIFDVGPRTHTHTHTHTKKIPIKQKIRFDKSGFLPFSFLFSFLFSSLFHFFFKIDLLVSLLRHWLAFLFLLF